MIELEEVGETLPSPYKSPFYALTILKGTKYIPKFGFFTDKKDAMAIAHQLNMGMVSEWEAHPEHDNWVHATQF